MQNQLKEQFQRCLDTLPKEDPKNQEYRDLLEDMSRLVFLFQSASTFRPNSSAASQPADPSPEKPAEKKESVASDSVGDLSEKETVRAALKKLKKKDPENFSLRDFLSSYGASNISNLDPSRYGDVLGKVDELLAG